MWSETQAAWAAGFFDGEGTVRITKPARRNWGAVIVSVVNTDQQTITFFHEEWQGSVKASRGIGNRRPYWTWTIAARQAVAFLERIRPYVLRDAVREKIDYAIAFQAQKAQSSTEEYREQQWIGYWWMGHLNQRGATNASGHSKGKS